jgi:hypothetical protein
MQSRQQKGPQSQRSQKISGIMNEIHREKDFNDKRLSSKGLIHPTKPSLLCKLATR